MMRFGDAARRFCIAALGIAAFGAYGENWPSWRGPHADGVAGPGNPPLTWSESKNIKWKIQLPGSGSSTPIVWDDEIFVTTAVPSPEGPRGAYRFNLICIDRATGTLKWSRTAREEVPHEGHHPTGSFASYSPITDGQRIWVNFGSRGLHCYDLQGHHQWSTDTLIMHTRNAFGEGSSPAIAGDAVVVVMDHEADSKIFAFNQETGALLWSKDRDEPTSWATPMPVEVDGAIQVITSATNLIRSYDLKTGEVIWECSGQTLNAIPSPVLGFGNVYCASGYRGAALQAIKLGGTGDLSGSDSVVWEVNKDTPYVASPLLYEHRIYVTRGLGGYVSCYEAQSGKLLFQREKLEGVRQIYASPVGAAGRVYLPDREGGTTVIKHADTFEVLARNALDDGFDASPVIIGDELYLKGLTNFYCIAEQ